MSESKGGGPTVSVITIFWNAEKFIREAVESVISQSYPGWELLLVDDGSSDGSTGIALAYAAQYPGQIIYLQHEAHRNRGAPASRNLGIRHCTGKLIAFLDADDVWLPHKLERQVQIMESLPGAALVYGASRYWDNGAGNPDKTRDWVPEVGVPTGVLYPPPALFTLLYPFGPATTPPPSDFMVRRSAIDLIEGFDEEFRGIYQLYEDQAFLVKIYLTGSIFVSSEEWDKYRIHSESCDAVTERGGHYDTVRAFFLKWFQRYLYKRGIRDPQMWSILREAVRSARIQLRTDHGSTATLFYMPNETAGARIAIQNAATGRAEDIQLNCLYYTLRTHRRYTVQFSARAADSRGAYVGVSAAHAPWSNLGLYRRIELTPAWQSFDLEFIAVADDDNARIHFDVGEHHASAEVMALRLRLLPELQLVEPSLALD